MPNPARRGWAFSPLGFVRRVVTQAYGDNILFLGSALTFDLLLAALPFALLLLAALGYFVYSGQEALSDVLGLLERVLPDPVPGAEDPLRRAETLIGEVVEGRQAYSVYGIPLFLWFATRFFAGARVALNEIFDTHESRSFLRAKLVDLFLVVVTVVLIVADAYLSVQFADNLWFGRFVGSVSTYAIGVALFFIVYTMAPTRTVRGDTAIVGAAFAALGFEVMKTLYGTYLAQFVTFDPLFSNANAMALLLLVVWLYAIVCVFLLGGEVAETYDLMRRQREQRAILA